MSTSIGQTAETKAAEYLAQQGYKILDRNWRTRVCEIDIVAEKDHVLYFVEVKYRKTETSGTGIDYITDHKLRQMQFAATCWVEDHNFPGDFELSAIEVSGESFRITNFLPSLT